MTLICLSEVSCNICSYADMAFIYKYPKMIFLFQVSAFYRSLVAARYK
jgi:hypothetical protein